MQSWTFQPVIHPLWIGLAAIGLLAAQLIRPSLVDLAWRRRIALAACRSTTIALALVMLLRPGCVTTVQKQQSALLIVQADLSRSMQLPHAAADVSRWEKMSQMFAANAERLKRLEQNSISVKWFGFDNQLYPLDEQQLPWASGQTVPDGPETDIGSTLSSAIRSTRQARLIGVVLVSDGVQNATDPRIELPAAVEQLAALQAPLYAVALGPVATTAQSADIAVVSLPDHFTGFVKNQQNIRVSLRARGFSNRELPVKLIVIDSENREQIAAARDVKVTQDDQELALGLALTPEQPGNYRLTVRVDPQPGEVTSVNNELSAFMTIYEGGLRVLYLHGDVGFETKYLLGALAASGDVEMDEQAILSRGSRNWPLDLSERIRRNNYDVFVLENVDSRALQSPNQKSGTLEAIAAAVEQGKGLAMLGGIHSFGPGGFAASRLADLLPVKMDRAEQQDIHGPVRPDLHIDRELKLRPMAGHFVTSLADETGADVWSLLPPVNGANRWIGVKDNAQILIESTDGDPILATQTVGGRVMALATDSTWRWRLAGFADAHKRFWRQMILWLAHRDGLANDNVAIDLPQRRFEPLSAVKFGLTAKTAAGDSIPEAQFVARLTLPDGQTAEIPVTRSEPKSTGQIDRSALATAGLYAIDVVARDGQREIGSTRAEFLVFDRDKEKSNPAGDPDQLARLANRTAEWGGRLLGPDEFGKLLDQIAAQPPDMQIEIPQKWQLGDTWRDGLAFLAAFVAALATEWYLRKRWGLV
jgi:uncharacterized membrane protein